MTFFQKDKNETFFCLPSVFTQSPNPWQTEHWITFMSSQSQAAFPTDHLRRRQQNRRPAPAHCAQISLSVTLDKIEKDQRRPSRQQPETIRNISWLARSPGKGLVATGPAPLRGFPIFQPFPNTKTEWDCLTGRKLGTFPLKAGVADGKDSFPSAHGVSSAAFYTASPGFSLCVLSSLPFLVTRNAPSGPCQYQ